jgi:hypothetical protein
MNYSYQVQRHLLSVERMSPPVVEIRQNSRLGDIIELHRLKHRACRTLWRNFCRVRGCWRT